MDTVNHLGETLGEIYEEFNPVSEKGARVFGYCFGFRPVVAGGAGVYAWCQYSTQSVDGFADFGKRQPSQKFESVAAARAWFRHTMAERIEANRAKWTRDGHRVVSK
jgi:hypothetical protein